MPKPNTVFEITCRTIQGRLLLKPTQTLKDLVLGVLGRALDQYPGISLYAFVFASNHYHLLLSTPDIKTLSRFMNHINSNIAREAGRLYEWKDKFWSRRYRAIPVLDDHALVARLKYILSHGAKENLISSPKQWPGASCIDALLYGKKLFGHWMDRTALYHAERKGNLSAINLNRFIIRYEVKLKVMPIWKDLSDKQRQNMILQIVEDIEEQVIQNCKANNKQPLGLEGVLQQDPDAVPKNVSKRPAPLCHASTPESRKTYRELYHRFVAAFRQAADLIQSGKTNAHFPNHCFPPPLAYIQPIPTQTPS